MDYPRECALRPACSWIAHFSDDGRQTAPLRHRLQRGTETPTDDNGERFANAKPSLLAKTSLRFVVLVIVILRWAVYGSQQYVYPNPLLLEEPEAPSAPLLPTVAHSATSLGIVTDDHNPSVPQHTSEYHNPSKNQTPAKVEEDTAYHHHHQHDSNQTITKKEYSLHNHTAKEYVSSQTNDVSNDVSYLMESNHTSRLTRFMNMSDFPPPKFNGCSHRGVCSFSSVCFSSRDRMLVFDVPGRNIEESTVAEAPGWWNPNSPSIPLSTLIVPNSSYMSFENVYLTKSMFVMNCWRQHKGSSNPAHALMGHGKLWALSAGYLFGGKNETPTFDMLVYHQCALPSWPWAKTIDELLLTHAAAEGTVSTTSMATIDDARIYLPFEGKTFAKPKRNDIIICGETVVQEPFTIAKYLHNNDDFLVSAWRAWVTEKLDLPIVPPGPATHMCSRQIRFALWKRTEGSSLRLLTNEEDIRSVVKEFSDLPLSIITASSNTPIVEQALLFRSFDALITPHGSHLTNMIFGTENTAYVEVASVFYDAATKQNGDQFAGAWVQSFGHSPTDTSLAKKMGNCTDVVKDSPACPFGLRLKFIHSNIVVNTTILRRDVKQVVDSLCSKQSK